MNIKRYEWTRDGMESEDGEEIPVNSDALFVLFDDYQKEIDGLGWQQSFYKSQDTIARMKERNHEANKCIGELEQQLAAANQMVMDNATAAGKLNELLSESDYDYNKKTNALIKRHAEQITFLKEQLKTMAETVLNYSHRPFYTEMMPRGRVSIQRQCDCPACELARSILVSDRSVKKITNQKGE